MGYFSVRTPPHQGRPADGDCLPKRYRPPHDLTPHSPALVRIVMESGNVAGEIPDQVPEPPGRGWSPRTLQLANHSI